MTNITDTDTTKSTTLANYTYGYDTASELTSYQDNSGNSLTYSYDANGELTSATGTLAGSSYSAAYNYDLNGNRTSTSTNVGGTQTNATYTTATGNELASDGTYTYTYDKDGNMLTQTDIATGSVTYYTWDYENRLTEEKVENSQRQVLNDEKFTYDVNDNRIGVSLNGTQQLYTVYDGSNPYIDFNGSGTLTQRYLTNPNALNQFYGQVSASGTTEWYLTDNINSIRQVVSTTGSVLDAITYDPYGNIVSQTNAANAPRFGFTGGTYDSITGSDQFVERPYKPSVGRFVSQDWQGLRPDIDPYRYVGNQPSDEIDPLGAFGWRTLGYFTPIGGFLIGQDIYSSYQNYTNAGVPVPQAAIAAYCSNMPIFGSVFSVYEMIDGSSLRGGDLGRSLNGWDYTFKSVGIGLDALLIYSATSSAFWGIRAPTTQVRPPANPTPRPPGAAGRPPGPITPVETAQPPSGRGPGGRPLPTDPAPSPWRNGGNPGADPWEGVPRVPTPDGGSTLYISPVEWAQLYPGQPYPYAAFGEFFGGGIRPPWAQPGWQPPPGLNPPPPPAP